MVGFQCGAHSDSRTGPNRGKATDGVALSRNVIVAWACSRVCPHAAQRIIRKAPELYFIIVIYETVQSYVKIFDVSWT